MEVLFCRENLEAMGREALEKLRKEAGGVLRIQEVKCIIACSECATQYIARANGNLIAANTAQKLVSKIMGLANLTDGAV